MGNLSVTKFNQPLFIELLSQHKIQQLLISISKLSTFKLKNVEKHHIELIFKYDTLVMDLINKQVIFISGDEVIHWIHLICAYSNFQMLKYLFENSNIPIEVDLPSGYWFGMLGASPLQLLLKYQMHSLELEERIKYLLLKGSNINHSAINGIKPLHQIIFNSYYRNFCSNIIQLICWNPNIIIRWDLHFKGHLTDLIYTLIKMNSVKLCEQLVKNDGLFIQVIPANFLSIKLYKIAYNTTPTIECGEFIPPFDLYQIKLMRANKTIRKCKFTLETQM
jgi:hypothetical protein